MCGIGGILRVWPAERRAEALATPHVHSIPEAWLDTIDESIKHRGPDGRGRFRDRAVRADGCVVDVALVHRRLSIIDHAGGHQPMLSLGRGMGVVGGKRLVLGDGLGLYERDAASELMGDGPGLDALIGASRVSESGHPDASRPPHLSPTREAPSDRVCVVFNGCVYNHRELRAELQRAGHVFTSDHSDTEVLVHGWREWGMELRDHLDGMYACVIWDRERGDVSLHRDDFGEKPLVMLENHGVLAFASTAAGPVRLASAFGKQLRADGSFLAGWVQYGWNQGFTPPDGLGGLIAGESRWASLRADGKLASCWSRALNPEPSRLDSHATDALLRAAVHSRLEADVPLGCFLSGGIDSALVAAFARERQPELRTFTVRMPSREVDESDAAAMTAKALRVRHTVLDCHARPAEDLAELIMQLGLPFGDSSLLPTHWVSRAAKREVAVALAGDGGDELFLGYERHVALRWLHWVERLDAETLGDIAERLPVSASPRSRWVKLARLLEAARYDGYKELVSIFPTTQAWELGLMPRSLAGWSGNRHFGLTTHATHATVDRETAVMTALRFDRMFYLPEDLMRKSDTASMAVALEVRSPMLERTLAAAAMNAPLDNLMPRGQRKGLLRQVASKYLPAEIVDRPKQGFAIPIGDWFRSDYGGLRTMLLDNLNSTEPFGPPGLGIDLNMKYVRQMLDEHLGTGMSGRVVRDHSQRLYMLLVLSVWAKWLGGLSSR